MNIKSAPASPAVRYARPAARPLALLGISLGYFMVLLDMTVLSVAEPAIARSLGTSVASLQWAVTGYTVAFGSLLLSAGAAADSWGAHRAFRAGVAVFGVGSLLSAFAPTLGVLIALRAVLGVAAAACVPASLALISRLYPEPAQRAKAIATWAAVSGAALAGGPVIGGVLVAAAGWRSVFLVSVPVAAAVLALTAGRQIRCPRSERAIDWKAQLAACVALGLLTDALIAAGSGALVHAVCSAAGSVAAGAAFAAGERRSEAPVLAPAVLRAHGMVSALLSGAAVNFAMTAFLFVLPLLFTERMHLDSARAGLAFLPMTLPFAFNPLVTARIVRKAGARRPLLAGLCLLAAAGIALCAAVLAGAGYPVMVTGLVCAGFGASFALPALVTAVASAAPAGTAGAASGLLNAVRQAGASLGVAASGAFVSLGPGGPGRETAWAFLIPAAACAAAAAGVLRSNSG